MAKEIWAMRKIALAAVATAWCLMTHDAAAQTAGSQDALVRDLMSGDRERVSRAVGHLPLVWPSEGDGRIRFSEDYEVTTEVVEALIAALERELRLVEAGDYYEEFHLEIRRAVVATGSPLALDVLLRTDWGGYEDLLQFGPGTLTQIAEFARGPEATASAAQSAQLALIKGVERWGPELGPEIREAIKEVAVLYLEGPPDGFASARGRQTWLDFLFDGAVELAKVLQDPELTAIARKSRHPSSGRPGISL